jgi:photosystem II stability/assembly factor-like uncharacterized protein
MAEDIVRTTMSQLWAQEAPNSVPVALGCYTIGDIETPLGDTDQIVCQDPVTPGRYVRKAVTQGPGGLPTTSVEGLLPKSRDYLEKLVEKGCEVNLYWTTVPCAPKTTFLNYTRGTVFQYAKASSLTKTGLMSRDSDEAAMHSMEFSGMKVADFGDAAIVRRTTAEVNGLRDIAGIPFDRCQGECGAALEKCDLMYIACNRTGAASANVLYSADGGITWANTSADPFAVSEDIACIETVMVDNEHLRVIVGRGTTDAAAPPEIAYADVDITAAPQTTVWTLVNTGATNAYFFLGQGSLFALDYYHIWCCNDGGQIAFSEDGGVTWTIQLTGVADEFRDIFFVDENVGICVGGSTGASHVIYTTTDGGVHWGAITMVGPGATVMATACALHDANRLWVGFENGTLYYSINGGDTWSARTLPLTVGSTAREYINDIERVDDFCMWIATGHTKTAAFWPAVYRTVNGGYDWEYFEATTAIAADALYFQKVLACQGYNNAMTVGAADSGPLGSIYSIYES